MFPSGNMAFKRKKTLDDCVPNLCSPTLYLVHLYITTYRPPTPICHFFKGAPPLNRELELEDIKVCPTYLQLCKRNSLFYPCTLHIWAALYKYKYAATTLLPGYNFSHHSTSRLQCMAHLSHGCAYFCNYSAVVKC